MAQSILIVLIGTMLALFTLGRTQSAAQPNASNRAAVLVQELRQFPAGLPAIARSDGSPDLAEEQRRRVYKELTALGPAAIPALADGLADADVQVRRNVAFFLNMAAGTWNKSLEGKLDIRGCLRSLIAALKDPDARVRQLAAQAVGTIGPDASSAVPALVALLAYPDDESRNGACAGLMGIGSRARTALPELRKALS